MAVTISGMFGADKTFFAGSPVVIEVNGLEWPSGSYTSPVTVVRVEVHRLQASEDQDSSSDIGTEVIGDFRSDAGGKSSVEFDISSALRSLWSDYDYNDEVSKAQVAADQGYNSESLRPYREYWLKVYTEYIASDGEFTVTSSGLFQGGQCVWGGLTEMERSEAVSSDVSAWEETHARNGDASTKPTSSPELVGSTSITSWVDVSSAGTVSKFYGAGQPSQGDDPRGQQDDWKGHPPVVLRDSVPYVDFLFVNRRGAVETCSARMKESMGIDVDTKTYARTGKPSFDPDRSLMSIASGGRRSWAMSSGYQTREWAEWWTLEFLMARRVWMLYRGRFLPVTVAADKKNVTIYDQSKQEMPSVEFTVTLALEG